MRDVIWTIIVVWVLYRLYNAFFRGEKKTVVIQKHEHHHYKEEVSVENSATHPKNPKKIDESEYTDFEEIK